MTIEFNTELIRKYDTFGPRYTSYPTAVQFGNSFTESDYLREIDLGNQAKNPLSLYFHIPFCKSLCFYCACAKIITHKQERSVPYLERLNSEIARQASLYNQDREVTQLHFGGGTPTFLTDQQFTNLLAAINANFTLAPKERREFSIEIDPRAVRDTTIPLLRELGFDRISLGVQDFDPKVQQAVNRIQSVEQTFAVLDTARSLGFHSTNLDLIYGLPFQTVETFSRTLDLILAKRPERLAVYSYAHIPAKVKSQSLIHAENLPSPREKLAILEMTVERLRSEGYIYLGMDHFALPEDALAKAKENGTLQRNFQGYSTHADTDLIGMGMTAIGKVNDCFVQYVHDENDYFSRIDAGKLALERGYMLNRDDKIRRDVIQSLMCQTSLDFADIEQKHQIDFSHYFQDELQRLEPLAEDNLVHIKPRSIEVTSAGQFLLRNIAMIFDAYLQEALSGKYFSKAI
jgi:oxygen-independent coproporphyrinogen-3 oxidase